MPRTEDVNNGLVNFVSLSQESYDNLATKIDTNLYFISDGKRIYKGQNDVTQNIIFGAVPATVTSASKNKIYITEDNNGDFLVTAIDGNGNDAVLVPGYITIDDITVTSGGTSQVEVLGKLIDDNTNISGHDGTAYDNKLATIGVIKEYVAAYVQNISQAVTDVSYSAGTLSVQKAGLQVPTTYVLENVAHDVEYDSNTLTLTVRMFGTTDLEIDLPKSNFIRDALYLDKDISSYGNTYQAAAVGTELHDYTPGELRYKINTDNQTSNYAGQGVIVFLVHKDIAVAPYVEEHLVIIPAEDLVTDYVEGNSTDATVDVNIANHTITASVRLSATDNLIEEVIESGQKKLTADIKKILTNNTDTAGTTTPIANGQVVVTDGAQGKMKHSQHILGGASFDFDRTNQVFTDDGHILATEHAAIEYTNLAINTLLTNALSWITIQ